jgi:hypothetical protein
MKPLKVSHQEPHVFDKWKRKNLAGGQNVHGKDISHSFQVNCSATARIKLIYLESKKKSRA